jgi:hypothetical protein
VCGQTRCRITVNLKVRESSGSWLFAKEESYNHSNNQGMAMSIDRGKLFLQQEGAVRIVRAAVPLELSEHVAEDRDTVLIADTITVSSEVRTGGHSLTIVCRALNFVGPGSIVLDGRKATKSFPAGRTERTQGHEGELDGPNGEDGGAGEPSGNLNIVCSKVSGQIKFSARGGPGGRPQDGGNGLQGPSGPHGPDLGPGGNHRYDETQGGQGLKGGNAGLPGLRGPGGTGGTVVVNTVLVAVLDPACSAEGGAPGDLGNAGVPGVGGPGGEGGMFTERVSDGDGPDGPIGPARGGGGFFAASTVKALRSLENEGQLVDHMISEPASDSLIQLAAAKYLTGITILRGGHTERTRGRPGAPGPSGDTDVSAVQRQQASPPVQNGTVTVARITIEKLATSFDAQTLGLVGFALEEMYRNAGSAAVSANFLEALNFYLELASVHEDASGSNEALSRFYSAARKINLGLDFFGYRPNQAPLLSYESYRSRIGQALDVGRIVEDSFNAYWDANEDLTKRRTALRTAKSAAEQKVVGQRVELDRVLTAVAAALKEIDALNAAVPGLYAVLMTAKQKLDGAIRARAPGCDLVGALTAVATIVAGIASGGAGFVAAAAAGAKLYGDVSSDKIKDPTDPKGEKTLADLWDRRYVLRDDLKEVGDAAKSVAENVTAVRDAVNALGAKAPEIPQFRMAREAFDEVAKSYADMPEASAYREVGYAYLNAVETRNQRILDYNAYILVSLDVRAQLRSAEQLVDAADSVLSGTSDPTAVQFVAALQALYRDTISAIGQMVHAERKALAYTFARPLAAPQSQLTLASLVAAHLSNESDWISAKERFAPKIELNEDVLEIQLKKFVSKNVWEVFLRTKVLPFVIRQDHPDYVAKFQNLPLLRMTGAKLAFPGARLKGSEDQIPWQLTHLGFERLYRSDGSVVEFVHAAEPIIGFSSISKAQTILKPDFSDRGLYTGLSPFAGWILHLSDHPQLGLNLQHLEGAKLTIHGFVMPTGS